MSVSPPSYELASALDGCDPAASSGCGLTYAGGGGSEASGRVALSADGRRVAFLTSAPSDLTSGPGGSTEGVPTPAWQVVLRDLDSDATTLVSAERDPLSGTMTARPVPGGALVAGAQARLLRGAALSADGSTVAWLGTHLPAQVPLAAGEAEAFEDLDSGTFPYDEPLWRRVADVPGAPTRRIVGGDGAADPFPDLTGKNTEFNLAEGWLGLESVVGVPQLSSDGRTVALIGNPTEGANVFLVDMAAGLSRAQAVRPLTREIVTDRSNPKVTINVAPYIPLNGHIFDLAISGDGERVAFVTARQRFTLSPPNLIGSAPVSVGLAELYVVDRESETLERVTHGLGGPGEPSLNAAALSVPEGANVSQGDGAGSPSFGAGGLIAFRSTASNLVAGDANEASDAFLVQDARAFTFLVPTCTPKISRGASRGRRAPNSRPGRCCWPKSRALAS